ncbi:hypothetical protein C7212DRAFT_230013 [Tuber magnatum]|uniref:FAD-binding 8 domain-containing protein n=1 Tax=Tuber magnatum TaxID=42249 RepID=A0A317SEM4_9PEZI|nr:hypothetical protein C7212DRAFT_230013 [Tuber magnatum]
MISLAKGVASSLVLKHLIYLVIPGILGGSSSTTYFYWLLILLLITANTLCIIIGTTNVSEVGSRAGTMALINFVPLFISGQINILASFPGFAWENYSHMHRWIGHVAVTQGLTHSVASSLLGPFLLCPQFIRRRLYEIFLTLHVVLSITFLGVGSKLPFVKFYLIAITASWGGVLCIWFFYILYRNLSVGTVTLHHDNDTVRISLRVSKAWVPCAGHYFFLRMPRVSPFAFTRFHPFTIAWWERDPGGSSITISFLIHPHNGFMKNLLSTHRSMLKTLLEGPYSHEEDYGLYGMVVLFASGIGIASYLTYIKRILERHRKREVNTQRILLVWQLRRECKLLHGG